MWIRKKYYLALYGLNATLAAEVRALQAEVEALKDWSRAREDALVAERKRSDNAVDRLLNTKGLPAVTPPEKITLDELSNTFEETEEGIAAIRKAIEQHGIEDVLLAGVE